MLMNGKEVNHLIIGGEVFDKSYEGKKVQILKRINRDSGITFDGNYIDGGGTGGVLSAGTEGYIILLKYLKFYYISGAIGNDRLWKGTWCRAEDIKILD